LNEDKNIKVARLIGLEKKVKEEIPLDILTLAKEIQTARAAKDYAKADEIRDKLLKEYSVEVEDTADGSIWRRF